MEQDAIQGREAQVKSRLWTGGNAGREKWEMKGPEFTKGKLLEHSDHIGEL